MLGLRDAICAHSLMGLQGGLRGERGEILFTVSENNLEGRVGAVALLHRAELLAILAKEVQSSRLHIGHECIGFEQTCDGVTARFKNGDTARGDVLIGADGLRSVIRAQLFGDDPPRYAGYTAWRAVVTLPPTHIVTTETWGRGRRFGIVPMRDGRVYWYATKNAVEGERDLEGQTKRNILELFRRWHAPIESLIEASDESSILRNDIYDRNPTKRWSLGRVTLLGDAAHPMTPNLGQGACQAIEDAAMLAVCLRASANLESGLHQYQARRLPRANAIVLRSRRIGEVGQWESLLLSLVRNFAIRVTPRRSIVRQTESLTGREQLTSSERALFLDPEFV